MKISEAQLRKIIQDVIKESSFGGSRASGYIAQAAAVNMAIALSIVVANGIINHYNQLQEITKATQLFQSTSKVSKNNFIFELEGDNLKLENTDTGEERLLDLSKLTLEGREELALKILESIYGNINKAERALNKYTMHSFGGSEAKLIRSILGLDDLSKYSSSSTSMPNSSYDSSSNMSVPYTTSGDNVGESLKERKLRRIIKNIIRNG